MEEKNFMKFGIFMILLLFLTSVISAEAQQGVFEMKDDERIYKFGGMILVDEDVTNNLLLAGGQITINGNEATIERSNVSNTPEFRIFHVDSTGNLILNDLTISNGTNPGTAPTV